MAANDCISEFIYDYLQEHAELYRICVDYYRDSRDGVFLVNQGLASEIKYSDLFLQTGHSLDNVVAGFIVGRLHNWLRQKEALLLAININQIPSIDKNVGANRKKLKSLPYPYKAEFWGALNRCDGHITWNENFESSPSQLIGFSDLSTLPLEVGYCDPRTLIWHVSTNRGFARWVYGSSWIYLYMLSSTPWIRWKDYFYKLVTDGGYMFD